jgi:hypothetical protein
MRTGGPAFDDEETVFADAADGIGENELPGGR